MSIKKNAAFTAPEPSAIRNLAINEFLQRHANEGALETAVPGVILYRFSAPNELAPVFREPRLSMALQGTKRIVLGEEEYVYGDAQCFVTAVEVSVVAQILEATPEKPWICFLLKLDLAMAREMISDFEAPRSRGALLPSYGVSTGPATRELLEAIYRLLRLLSTPSGIPTLSNLIKREIINRLLTREQGHRLRRIAFNGSYDHCLARAIALLKQNYAAPLSVEALAKAAGMGVSTLHNHFNALTSMSLCNTNPALRDACTSPDA